MKRATIGFITALCFTLTFTLISPAQESPQWHLPNGAIKRFGNGTPEDIAYSPDGTKLAIATHLGIWIYDAHTAEPLNLFTNGACRFNTIAFSPDGKTLASDINDNYLCLWDVETGRQVRVFGPHIHFSIYRIIFSPDGKKIASAGSGDTIRLWDIQTGTQLLVIRWHFQTIISLAFSPDSKSLVSACSHNRVCLWDTNDGSEIRTFIGHTEPVNLVAFHPDGKTIASSSRDNTIRLWDAETGKQVKWSITRHAEGVSALAFSPDGYTFAAADRNNKIYLWRCADLFLIRTLKASNDTITRLAFSPDSHTLVSLSQDGDIRSWNLLTGWQRHQITGHSKVNFLSVGFSPDGQTIASCGWDEIIRLWDANTGSMKGELIGHTDETKTVVFSPDSTTIASGSEDNTLRLWDANTQTLHQTFNTLLNDILSHGNSDVQRDEVRRHISNIQFSPNGKTVACLLTYGPLYAGNHFLNTSISLFDVETSAELHTIAAYTAPTTLRSQHYDGIHPTHHTEPVYSIAFTPDGNMIASCSHDRTIRLWDVKTGKHSQVLIQDAGWARDLTFSPDGKILAFVSNSSNIHLWHMQAEMITYTFTDADVSFHDLAFSQDSNVLAAGDNYNTIRLWDVNYGMLLRTFGEYRDDLFFPNYYDSLAFHPDGNTLMSAARNGTIVFWDTMNLTPINTAVMLSPTTLVSPSIGNQLKLSINITDGEDVMGYQTTVNYDTTALRYVQSTNVDYLNGPTYVLDPIVEDGSVRLAATTFGETSYDNGTLATITFEVVYPITSTVSLTEVLLTDTAGKSIKPNITASAEIIEAEFLPEDVNMDGVVNLLDLTFVAVNFGKTGKKPADVNNDGVVNIVDLALVAAAISSNEGENVDASPSAFWSDLPTRAMVETWLHMAQQHKLTDSVYQHGVLFLQNLLKTLPPTQTALLPNYPNPFNPETWIPYQLASPANVRITIYTYDGKLVKSLPLGHQAIGRYTDRKGAAYWDGRNALGEPVTSGIYIYALQAGNYSATRKMVIAK